MEALTESFQAAESVGSYRCVYLSGVASGQRQVGLWDTSTLHCIGISQDAVSTNGSVPVATRMGDIVRAVCDGSVSVGSIVRPATATGGITEYALPATAAAAGNIVTVGIALENGQTNAVINVLLNVENRRNS